MTTRYDVLLGGRRVGELRTARGRLAFEYDAGARSASSYPLSLSLPWRAESFDDLPTRAYFENLLPESQFRRLIANSVDLSPDNTAGLLGAIGGECVGAVSVWPVGAGPEKTPRYREISTAALRQIFAARDGRALAEAQEEARLSVPGVEDKIALRRTDGGWQLPLAGAPSTHIVKRPRDGFPALVENEHFCTSLAERAGLGAVETEPLDFGDGVRVLASRRFDRPESGGTIERLHQEDFCQALTHAPSEKYEGEGGPSLQTIAKALRDHSDVPIADVARLVRWAAFNYMIGNEDAHGKNVALAYDRAGRIRLAPFYDLVSTEMYKGLKRKAAMRIGGEYRYRMAGREHWVRLGEAIGLRERALINQVADTAEAVLAAVEEIPPSDSETVGKIRELVVHRAGILLSHRRRPPAP